jgi:hypothetical protein
MMPPLVTVADHVSTTRQHDVLRAVSPVVAGCGKAVR